VVIVVDDLDSKSLRFMPAVDDQLIAGGTSFSNFFATTPLCCPSRASILRGQYAHNHGVLRNTGDNAGFAAFSAAGEEQQTLATMLDGAGYATALVGKYLNGYSSSGPQQTYVPPGWDYWVAGIDHDAYSGFNYALNINGEITQFGERDEDYSTDVFTRYALDFLDQSSGAGQPFFLYLAPYAPHSPMPPAPRHKGMFNGATAPRSPAFDERNVRDKPQWVRQTARFSDARISRIDEEYQRRLESLQAVDDMVSSVEQRLQETNALGSTYIFFLSDNGMFLGEHRQPHGKDAPYDPAARIPLIVTGPTVPHGATVNQLALNIDLTPTIAELAGLSPPDFVDGRSLVPILDGDSSTWRRMALLEGFGNETESLENSEPATPAFRALRSENVLYVEYETGERELYDLRRDPDQLANLAHDAPKTKLRALSHELDALSVCGGAGCRTVEDERPPALKAARSPKSPHRDHKQRRKRHGKEPRAHQAASESASVATTQSRLVGGSTNATATFRVRLPNKIPDIQVLLLQVYVASIASGGTLVATLVDQPTLEAASPAGNDERVGSVSIDGTGWVTMSVADLYGDSGRVWLTLSGRDGAEVLISSNGSNLAPRLISGKQSTKSPASRDRSRSHVGAHSRSRHGVRSRDSQ
jgi:arylsulfatase A-like enzyme